MKKNKKPTLSFGIPAHNEEGNIGNLLKSILGQRSSFYTLEKIYVVCDGCTDKTAETVKKFQRGNRKITLFERERFGKPESLNLIYKINMSDFILTMDADLVFEKLNDVDLMMETILQDKNLNLVGPRHVPAGSDTWMGKFSDVSYESFEDAVLKLNDGNNFFAIMGAYLLRKKFSKTIRYSRSVHADQTILYGLAVKKNKNAFKLVKEARVLFRGVSTFADWRLLGTRSVIADRENTAQILGKKILKEYYMPKRLYFVSLLKWFVKDPVNTLGSIIMNIYIRMFPLNEKMPKKGIWETTQSSKKGISAKT